MKLSFVIPAYNEEKRIGACLTEILKSVANISSEYEIIVVDNASTDRTKEIAESFPGVRVVRENRKGIVWARSAGYAASSGDIIANIDADNLMDEKWVSNVIRSFEEDPELLALSGPLYYYDVPWTTHATIYAGYAVGLVVDKFHQIFLGGGSMLQGGNFVLRREAVEKIGGFDTSIEFYGEDTDIGRRVNQVGKVRWTFSLPIKSSGRRLTHQGFFSTGFHYIANFVWINLLGRPFTKSYIDIRK